ncbi:Mu transposase C-terminal domain-containing protein [Mycetocola sp.]|uniref:Mu transposase C-terminal domain-containing protein n=1 Tax=Mycetocola sp. TaxID=1871042 RepID=UPI003988B223
MSNTIRRIQLGTNITLVDGVYEFVESAGGLYKLRNTHTNEYTTLVHTELSARLVEVPTHERDQKVIHVRSDVTVTKEMVFLAAHLEELLHGTPLLPGGEPRAVYAVGGSVTQKMRAKTEELSSCGIPMSMASLKRKRASYETHGVAGLADRRTTRSEKPLSRADERVIEALVAVMEREKDESTGTLDRLSERLAIELAKRYPGAGLEVPSKSTLRRYVEQLDRGRYTLGSAVNRRTAANSPKRKFRARPPLLPGSEVQIDTTPLDLLVRGDRGEALRPTLTIMVDKATRSIIAHSLLFTARSVDHAMLLGQCLVPRASRPHGDYFAEFELPELPWAKLVDVHDRPNYNTARPFIVPQRILTDNGSDFVSKNFREACERFGISLTESSVYTPTDKGIVERTFGSIKTMFCQHLPGFLGGDVSLRGKHPEKDDLLDIFTLTELFDRWVEQVWQNTPHEGLRDPLHPGVKHTPNSMYGAMFDVTGFVPVPLTADDYIGLLPKVNRTLQADGIEFKRRQYDSSRLNPWRGLKGPSGSSLAWDVSWDPNNPAAVWVKDPDDETWITCRWQDRDAFRKPFSKEIREHGLDWLERLAAYSPSNSGRVTSDLLRAAKAQQAAEEKELYRINVAKSHVEKSGFKLPELTVVAAGASTTDTATIEDEDEDFEEFAPHAPGGWFGMESTS